MSVFYTPARYEKEKLERIAFLVPKGERAKIQKFAQRQGYKSTNSYLTDLVKKDMEKENGQS